MTSPDLSIPEEEMNKVPVGTEEDHTRMRMIQLAEAGEISQSVKCIKKQVTK